MNVSIIAVHGLAGKGFRSWQNQQGGMWLRDYLPLHFPNIKVYIYGYPSTLKGISSRASIQDYTDGLIKAISSVRSTARVRRSAPTFDGQVSP